ncbi:hypothetical protein SAMN05216326_12513 [Nitrosomonas marina]|uniref:Uncharacterized protein n=1 Tax=Nitrosomonas marina TaxID=917 RepID=A0A1I0E738_9PROT|nr:hypothetical protein [Nitrosomonas marina]SET40246.1 hypothetical protein SAMN05216326_12513 [Nitrosomonas marina]
MDKVVELNREYWGRVHDMCEGTKVKPRECVRWKPLPNDKSFDYHPDFSEYVEDALDDIEFAVTVLEDRPVFVGDSLYCTETGQAIDWGILAEIADNFHLVASRWTWHKKQKRTFLLNGEELPCPVEKKTEFAFLFNNIIFYFDTFEDREKINHSFSHLLIEARDKP